MLILHLQYPLMARFRTTSVILMPYGIYLARKVSVTFNYVQNKQTKIFDLSVALVSNIDTLLTENTQPADGPSLDDFSSSDANRGTSNKVP